MGGVASKTEAPWQEPPQLVLGRTSTPAGVGSLEVYRRQDSKGFLSLKAEPQRPTLHRACVMETWTKPSYTCLSGFGPGRAQPH